MNNREFREYMNVTKGHLETYLQNLSYIHHEIAVFTYTYGAARVRFKFLMLWEGVGFVF